jgi:hypothetical protein
MCKRFLLLLRSRPGSSLLLYNCLYGILVYHKDILQVLWMLFDQSLTKYVISYNGCYCRYSYTS